MNDWWESRLAYYAEVEAWYWPSIYMKTNALAEEIWYHLHYANAGIDLHARQLRY